MDGNEKVEAALAGGQETGGGESPDAAKELEKSRHTNDVLAGRLKAQGEELKRLREELRVLNAAKAADEAVDTLTPEQLGDVPREFATAAAAVSAKMLETAKAEQKDEVDRLRAELEERDRRFFYGQIGRDNAKFFDDVAPGGDKASFWAQFKAANRETYDAVLATRDAVRFNALVDSFYRLIGVRNPGRGQGASAAPDPATTGGGSRTPAVEDADGQRKYTSDEYLALLEKAEEARDGGDMSTYRAMTDRLNKALNEGRVGQ